MKIIQIGVLFKVFLANVVKSVIYVMLSYCTLQTVDETITSTAIDDHQANHCIDDTINKPSFLLNVSN